MQINLLTTFFLCLVNKDPCSIYGKVLSGTSTEDIPSPNYPEVYPNNAYCKWLVQAPPGLSVQLTFEIFDVEDR